MVVEREQVYNMQKEEISYQAYVHQQELEVQTCSYESLDNQVAVKEKKI